MKKLKLIPFYLLLTINLIVVLFLTADYPDIMNYDMHWGCEGCGWAYKSKTHYTIMTLFLIFLVVAPSIYALKNRKINLKRAYIAILIPFFMYLLRYIYFIHFFNI